ncbi:hypothetical protein F5B20DRAFT_375773 [Whalleya microplaca]|nr:hypothetical protein F5B20DRAFT_375773 [Whalleya microplaca]
MIRYPQSNRNMSSWVPDWNENPNMSLYFVESLPFLSAFKSTSIYRYSTVDELNAYDSIANSSIQVLKVKGMQYGRIGELGPLMQISLEEVSSRNRDVPHLTDTVESIRLGETLPRWPNLITQVSRKDIYQLLGGGLETSDPVSCDSLSSHVATVCDNAQIFVTLGGKLGLASREAQKGDLVCLIRGALKPCILREKGNSQWSIICGNCFLLGISTGCLGPEIASHFEYMYLLIIQELPVNLTTSIYIHNCSSS